jgi:hypothetical protein
MRRLVLSVLAATALSSVLVASHARGQLGVREDSPLPSVASIVGHDVCVNERLIQSGGGSFSPVEAARGYVDRATFVEWWRTSDQAIVARLDGLVVTDLYYAKTWNHSVRHEDRGRVGPWIVGGIAHVVSCERR